MMMMMSSLNHPVPAFTSLSSSSSSARKPTCTSTAVQEPRPSPLPPRCDAFRCLRTTVSSYSSSFYQEIEGAAARSLNYLPPPAASCCNDTRLEPLIAVWWGFRSSAWLPLVYSLDPIDRIKSCFTDEATAKSQLWLEKKKVLPETKPEEFLHVPPDCVWSGTMRAVFPPIVPLSRDPMWPDRPVQGPALHHKHSHLSFCSPEFQIRCGSN